MNLLKRIGLRLVWEPVHYARYAFPSILTPGVALSPTGELWLSEMRKNGIIKIEDKRFQKIAEYLEERYFARLEKTAPPRNIAGEELGNPDLFAWDVNNNPKYQSWGEEVKALISYKDPALAPLFLDPDLTGVLYNYFRRQPYYRNQVVLQKVTYVKGMDPHGDDSFHVDNLHQISIMLLVSDQTERDTHMEYCIGSNRRPIWREGIYMAHAASRRRAEQYSKFKCVGKKGTLFVFDTSGFHRRYLQEGNPRKMLHLNVTTGHHMASFREQRTNWASLLKCPSHTSKMFRYMPK